MKPLRALFVAVDGGPQEALAPLALASGTTLAHIASPSCKEISHWQGQLKVTGASIMVVGTSNSPSGCCIESAARQAATLQGTPVVVVEDSPGNFQHYPGTKTACLFVESAAAAELAKRRAGITCPVLLEVSPARYDALRVKSTNLRRATMGSRGVDLPSSQGAVVLWVGQPEIDEALICLESVVPMLLAGNHKLMFRAHPRDTGRDRGAYSNLASALGGKFLDVTELTKDEVLGLAPRLLLTQYSSMLVDAGFYGIPALCLLLPGAAGDSLYKRKGYKLPLPCRAGAAAFATTLDHLAISLDRALFDDTFRTKIIKKFDKYFSTEITTTERTLAEIALVAGPSNPCESLSVL